MSNDVADPKIIGEAVGFHLLGEDFGRGAQLVDGFELLCQVPLAFVGRVIARVPQHMAERGDLGRHAFDPGKIRIVEHSRLLDVLAGIDH